MKPSFLSKALAVVALVAGFFTTSASALTIQGEAVAVAQKGNVEYSSNGFDWHRLQKNDVLRPGTEIRTGKDSSVDLFLNYNGPAIRVQSEARLVLAKLNREERGFDIVTDTLLKVKSGSIVGYTQKASPGSSFIIETPKSIANITGTAYTVTAAGYVICTTGSVEVRYSPTGAAFSTPILVPAGFTYIPGTGVVPTSVSDFDNTTAVVSTLSGNIRRFNLARNAKVEIKAVSN